MGSFYENLTVVGASAEDVVGAVGSEPSFVASGNGVVWVFPEGDERTLVRLGKQLSADLAVPVIGVYIHDDDIFGMSTWAGGQLLDELAVPDPKEYFGIEIEDFADLGVDLEQLGFGDSADHDPERLVRTLGRGKVEQLRTALSDDFVFATERHTAVFQALSLPVEAAGWGFRYLTHDPDGFEGGPLTHVPG